MSSADVEKLKSTSPILSQYVDEKKLMVVGGVYRLEDGRVDWIA